MSKYYRADDIENLITNIAPDGEVFELGMDALKHLPAIEVSEDCISRVTALDIAVAFVGAEMVDRMLTAPSVVPKLDK